MYTYDQTNIKNNIIYFPLWRVKYLKHRPWTWEERYDLHISDDDSWTHNCRELGAIMFKKQYNHCPYCGANKLNEPSEEAVHDYMELNYD